MKWKYKDLIEFMEKNAPLQYAEEWDNVGIMLGNYEKDIDKILLCLDVTPGVVEEALEKKVDLISSHHPLIFKKINRVLQSDYKGSILYNLIKGDISVYSAHTNLDVVLCGVNRKLAEKLDLVDLVRLKGNINLFEKENYFGLGAVGYLKIPLKLEEFIEYVKNRLNVKNLRMVGTTAGLIEKIAVFCGSFDDDLETVLAHKADVLITGDLKYHTAIDAMNMNMCLVDAGHFSTEYVIIQALEKTIHERFPGIEVYCNIMEHDPFETY